MRGISGTKYKLLMFRAKVQRKAFVMTKLMSKKSSNSLCTMGSRVSHNIKLCIDYMPFPVYFFCHLTWFSFEDIYFGYYIFACGD